MSAQEECTFDACCGSGDLDAKGKVRIFWGEFIGTFLMCFFGIGAVANATLFSSMNGPLQVGLVWGITIAIAIYVTRNLSAAHFNPAVSFGMCVSKRLSWRLLPLYIVSQCTGAFVAAAALWGLFADSVFRNMANAGIGMSVAGSASSIWCEVFPNTSAAVSSPVVAGCAEGIGVFILLLVIFSMTEDCNVGRPSDAIFPLFIGLTITVIICVVGPITDAGLNPARDLMPRLLAALVGWGSIACSWTDIAVYVVSPLIGGGLAAIFFTKVVEPHHQIAKDMNS